MAMESDKEKQIYDSVATDYDMIWQVPYCKMLLTLMEREMSSLGSWENKNVLDLACGTGIGLRIARSLGSAGKLVGVDISSEMIRVAKQVTPESVQLHIADCSQPLDHLGLEEGGFDVVLGMWLLNYASTAAQMQAFWDNIARYLRSGGQFVGMLQNHDSFHHSSVVDMKHGLKETHLEDLPKSEGEGVKRFIEFDTKPEVGFEYYILKGSILEEKARNAGMSGLKYVRPDGSVLPKEEVENRMDWWQDLLEDCPNQVIIATKAPAS